MPKQNRDLPLFSPVGSACRKRRPVFAVSLAAGTFLALVLMNFCSFARVCGTLRSQTLRLHVLANSDCAADQQLKLTVRDALVEECARLFRDCDTLEQTARKAAENLDLLQQTAQKAVQRQGSAYPVEVRLENMWFDTRCYDEYTLPAGQYRTLQVRIGRAEGRNWWCVLFPSLCLPAAEQDTRQEALRVWGEEGVRLTTGERRYKFAIAQLWEKLQR